MNRTFVLFLLSAIVVTLCGCEPADQSKANGKLKPDLSTVEGLAEYLVKLPAVKEVTEWANEYSDGLTITTNHYQVHTTLLDTLMLSQLP